MSIFLDFPDGQGPTPGPPAAWVREEEPVSRLGLVGVELVEVLAPGPLPVKSPEPLWVAAPSRMVGRLTL